MRENALIQFSSGRYYQGRGVLQKIGEESALLGHKALIVVDDTVWKKTEERVRESLRSASVEFVRYAFSGAARRKTIPKRVKSDRLKDARWSLVWAEDAPLIRQKLLPI